MVAPPDNDVLWARALHVKHNGSPALTGVSLGVREGEILAVNGPRGCGKTTLLRCLSGQLLPQQGEVWFNSTPVHTMGPFVRERLRRDRFGWIDPEPHLVPELTAWENVALPLMLRGASHRVAKPAAQEWLDRLDIGDCARKRPHALLQAERQRVSIARALVTTPNVLFADEPTAPLHRADRAHVLRTLTTAARSHGITVVLATHDAEVATLADRTVTLLDGRRVNTVHLPAGDGTGTGTGAGGSAPAARSGGASRASSRASETPGASRGAEASRGVAGSGAPSGAGGPAGSGVTARSAGAGAADASSGAGAAGAGRATSGAGTAAGSGTADAAAGTHTAAAPTGTHQAAVPTGTRQAAPPTGTQQPAATRGSGAGATPAQGSGAAAGAGATATPAGTVAATPAGAPAGTVAGTGTSGVSSAEGRAACSLSV